jgi:hypothetical protein
MIYGPPINGRFHKERAVLQILSDHPAIQNPRLVTVGEHLGLSPYVVMIAIAGSEIADAWTGLTRNEQIAIAIDIGAILFAI